MPIVENKPEKRTGNSRLVLTKQWISTQTNGNRQNRRLLKPNQKYQLISVTMVAAIPEALEVLEEMVVAAMVAAMTLKKRKTVPRHLQNYRQRTVKLR